MYRADEYVNVFALVCVCVCVCVCVSVYLSLFAVCLMPAILIVFSDKQHLSVGWSFIIPECRAKLEVCAVCVLTVFS